MRTKSTASRPLPILLALLLLLLLLAPAAGLLSACGSTAATTAATTAAGAATTAEKAFTAAELAKFDGKNGSKAYIAVDGIVYDVTTVSEWANKLHAGMFAPGKDYSAEIKKAPHGVDKLLKATRAGVLKG